jgi:hypothetical protein
MIDAIPDYTELPLGRFLDINVSAGGADDDRLSRANQLLAATVAAQEVVEGAEVQTSG